MKKAIIAIFALILLALLSLAFPGCTPAGSPEPIEPATANKAWIPNWYPGDTLYAFVIDNTGATTGEYDTITTWTSGDTTGIYYHGLKMYLWWNMTLPNNTLEPDKMVYGFIAFNTVPFDTTGALSWGMANTVSPHKYVNQYGDWVHQRQRVYFNKHGNLSVKVYNGYYESKRTY